MTFEELDALYQRDMGIGVPYPETEGGGRTMVIYRHISGVVGTFYKRYRPTGLSYYYIMVDTFDGRKFYAPEKEWEILK